MRSEKRNPQYPLVKKKQMLCTHFLMDSILPDTDAFKTNDSGLFEDTHRFVEKDPGQKQAEKEQNKEKGCFPHLSSLVLVRVHFHVFF
jgi:hypothetical protein